MDTLQLLLIQNQGNLDKLRGRALHCHRFVRAAEQVDTDRLFGPYSEYWEEWHEQLLVIIDDLHADVTATALFVNELRLFIYNVASKQQLSKKFKQEIVSMQQLATEARLCQLDMLHMTDEQLADLRDFTQKLFLFEVMDNLNEE